MGSLSRVRPNDVNIRSGPLMREYGAIVERIAAERPGLVLDWGCGDGQVSHLLRERGVEIESFEYCEGSETALVRLEEFPDVEAHVSGDPVHLPFPDGHFDIVLSSGVLEHVQQPGASLEELHRVLHPGGRLFIYKLPNRLSYLERIARRAGLYYHGAYPDDRVYDRRSSVALVSSHGFRVDAFRRTNLLPLTVAHPLASRLSGPIWGLNRALGHVPGVSLLATNLELDATAI